MIVKNPISLNQRSLSSHSNGAVEVGCPPHVLIVSNHVGAKRYMPHAGIFVDRQIASMNQTGVKVSTFDIGTSHSPIRLFCKWLELRRQVKQVDPDLVHGQYGTVVGIMSVFAGRPSIISFCGNDLQSGASVSLLRELCGFILSNFAALCANGLICKSEQLRHALWWRKARAVVIPSGVDLDLFIPGPQDEAREELGWNLESPIAIVNVGGDAKVKGIDFARAAMKFVHARLPNAELQVLASVEPIRMPLYYQAADVLLCTSISEGSPNVVKEALACNLPVVSTPVGDVPERLAGVYPSSVMPRDPRVFGEAIVNILLTRQRSNGRDRIVHLGLDQIAGRLLDAYRSVLNG